MSGKPRPDPRAAAQVAGCAAIPVGIATGFAVTQVAMLFTDNLLIGFAWGVVGMALALGFFLVRMAKKFYG